MNENDDGLSDDLSDNEDIEQQLIDDKLLSDNEDLDDTKIIVEDVPRSYPRSM